MKVLDIENIKIVGKNKKYTKNKYTGQLTPTGEYRAFKSMINMLAAKTSIEPPYSIKILIWCAHDIDGPEVAILDALQGKSISNDKYILEKYIRKYPIKRGTPGRLVVYVDHFSEEVH